MVSGLWYLSVKIKSIKTPISESLQETIKKAINNTKGSNLEDMIKNVMESLKAANANAAVIDAIKQAMQNAAVPK